MRQHQKSKRPRTEPDINDYFAVTQRRFELKNEEIEKYRAEVARCWSRMDLPIRFFDRPEYKRMVQAVLTLARCTSHADKINMSAYHLKLQLDKQSDLAKQIIISRGPQWASENKLELMVDHFSSKVGFQVDAHLMALSANQIDAQKNLVNQSAIWPASI